MHTDELIRMANQIGQYFASYPEDTALQGIREHIQRFWEPRMRAQLDAHIAAGGQGLLAQVQRALQPPPPAQ